MTLGEKLKKIRQDNHLSQEDFSEQFHMTRQTVSNWENGKSFPDLETLVKISNIFNVSTDELLKEDEAVVQQIDSEKKKKNTLLIVLLVLIVGINFSGFFFYQELKKQTAVSFSMEDHKTIKIAKKKETEVATGYFSIPKKGNYELKVSGESDDGEVEVKIKNTKNGKVVYESKKNEWQENQLVLLEEASYQVQVNVKDAKVSPVSLSYQVKVANK